MANSLALLVGAIAMAAAATAAAAEMQKCMEEPYDFWKKNVAQGDRGFFIHAAKTYSSFTCAAKGTASNDVVLDPVVQSHINIGEFAQKSVMPCRLFQEQFACRASIQVERPPMEPRRPNGMQVPSARPWAARVQRDGI